MHWNAKPTQELCCSSFIISYIPGFQLTGFSSRWPQHVSATMDADEAFLAAKYHFLSAVAKEKKLFVIGDERAFRRLGQERLARRA